MQYFWWYDCHLLFLNSTTTTIQTKYPNHLLNIWHVLLIVIFDADKCFLCGTFSIELHPAKCFNRCSTIMIHERSFNLTMHHFVNNCHFLSLFGIFIDILASIWLFEMGNLSNGHKPAFIAKSTIACKIVQTILTYGSIIQWKRIFSYSSWKWNPFWYLWHKNMSNFVPLSVRKFRAQLRHL